MVKEFRAVNPGQLEERERKRGGGYGRREGEERRKRQKARGRTREIRKEIYVCVNMYLYTQTAQTKVTPNNQH